MSLVEYRWKEGKEEKMDIWMMLAMLVVNAVALFIIYQFVKKMSKMNKIIFIAISFAVHYILVSLVCLLSGWGMGETVIEQSKTYLTYVFVPVNIILSVPFLAASYQKYQDKRLKPEKLVKRAIAVIVFMIIVLIAEYFYFQSVFENIKDIAANMQEQTQTNAIMTNETEEGQTNTITNEEQVNEITNTIANEEETNTVRNELANETAVPYVNREE